MSSFFPTVWKCGDHIDTDLILPSTYLNCNDPAELAKHCMEPLWKECGKLFPGQAIVAGRNFGNGSTREQAVVSLIHAGVRCVIAEGFARGFYRNAFNRGLLLIEAPGISGKVESGNTLQVDPYSRQVYTLEGVPLNEPSPLSPFMQEMLACGGIVPYLQKNGGSLTR